MIDKALLLFKPSLPPLSENERKVLKLLTEAGKLVAPIFLAQEKQLNGGISKEEIEAAAKKDPLILSLYTVIEKVDGKLVATPYHIKYADLLKPVIARLIKAAAVTHNKGFGKALSLQAEALSDGSYEQATIAWLKTKSYILDISIGPVEYRSAYSFPVKAAYQAWVGILDAEDTKQLNNYKRILLSAKRKALVPDKRVEYLKGIKTRVDKVILFSGLMAQTKPVGVNLPVDVGIVEKYGSGVTLFNEVNDLRLETQIIPTFRSAFSKEFRDGFSWGGLRRGNISYIAIHQLAHHYLYYRNAAKNLKDLFTCVYELAARVLGFRMAGSLLLADIITSKQLESMIVAYLCRSFYLMKKEGKNKVMINSVLGSAIFINLLTQSGALKQLKGKFIPNFMKTLISLQELSYKLESLLVYGTRKDAADFIKKFGQTDSPLKKI